MLYSIYIEIVYNQKPFTISSILKLSINERWSVKVHFCPDSAVHHNTLPQILIPKQNSSNVRPVL